MERFKQIQEKEKRAYINDDKKRKTSEAVVQKIEEMFEFETVLDLGCGQIKYPFLLVTYVDGNPDASPDILADLAEPLDVDKADLVWSIEVAEHIEPESADTFADNLTKHAKSWIIMTTCPPHATHSPYEDVAHHNEQPKSYWIEKIESRGFKYQPKAVEELQAYFKSVPDTMRWFRNDLMVYVRDNS